jgi:hypothetical protein
MWTMIAILERHVGTVGNASALVLILLAVGCGGSSDIGPPGSAGNGVGGTAGFSGAAGTRGSAGSAGSAGMVGGGNGGLGGSSPLGGSGAAGATSSSGGAGGGGGTTSSGIEILTKTVASTDSIDFDLQLTNNASAPLDLSPITIEYWFTWDLADPSAMPALEVSCIYTLGLAGGSCSAFFAYYFEEVTPALTEADYVLVMYFSSGAGMLGAGATVEIGSSVSKSDFSMFDQTNDWSYDPSTSFTPNPHVTAYENYQLIYGVEPP